jgi:hypothetical protein
VALYLTKNRQTRLGGEYKAAIAEDAGTNVALYVLVSAPENIYCKRHVNSIGQVGLMLRPSFALDCHYTLHIAIVDS